MNGANIDADYTCYVSWSESNNVNTVFPTNGFYGNKLSDVAYAGTSRYSSGTTELNIGGTLDGIVKAQKTGDVYLWIFGTSISGTASISRTMKDITVEWQYIIDENTPDIVNSCVVEFARCDDDGRLCRMASG